MHRGFGGPKHQEVGRGNITGRKTEFYKNNMLRERLQRSRKMSELWVYEEEYAYIYIYTHSIHTQGEILYFKKAIFKTLEKIYCSIYNAEKHRFKNDKIKQYLLSILK